MQVASPCDWIIERLRAKRPFFAVRINDGEMIQMYRTRPEGSLLGTVVNPVWCHYDCGNAYREMLADMANLSSAERDNVLIGCSWNTDRADEMGRGPFAEDIAYFGLEDANWCHEHWPLEGVIDGSTIRLLEEARKHSVVLVTCKELAVAANCLNDYGSASLILSPSVDSWLHAAAVEQTAVPLAQRGCVFLWAGGCGLKPTAWELWREYPTSSHIDIGHLFNGAFGLRDYGWLERGDGPWHETYFRDFAPWVKSHLPAKRKDA